MDFCNIEIVKYGNRFFMIDKTVCKPIFISQRVFEVIGEYKSGKTFSELQQKYGEKFLNSLNGELERLKRKQILTERKIKFSTEAKKAIDEYRNQPIEILEGVLMVSQNCNLACRYCYGGESGTFNQKGFMSEEIADKCMDFILQNAGEQSFQKIIFFGGEPLLNYKVIKHTIERWNSVKDLYPNKNIYFGLTTNGVLLNEEIVRFFKKNNVGVTVSVDGPPEIHNYNRPFRDGSKSFDATMAGIELLKKYDIPISVRTTYTKQTDIEQLYDFLEKENFDIHNIAMVDYPLVCPKEDYQIDLSTYKKLVSKQNAVIQKGIMDIKHKEKDTSNAKQLSIAYQRANASKRKFPFLCGAGNWLFSFGMDGKIYPCNRVVGDERFCIGNLSEGIVKEKMVDIYRHFLEASKKCDDCWVVGLCRGRCFHQKSFESYGCTELPEELCEVYRDNYAESMVFSSELRKNMKSDNSEMKDALERFEASNMMKDIYGIGE